MGSVSRNRCPLRAAMLASLCIPWSAPSFAMTPAVAVAEIARGAIDAPLAACPGLQVRRGSVHFDKSVARWLARRGRRPAGWHVSRRLRHLEDARLLLLLRTPEHCEAMLSSQPGGRLPFGWRRMLPFRAWRLNDDRLWLSGKVATDLRPKHLTVLPVQFSRMPPLRLYHHGRLEIYLGLRPPTARKVGVDDSVSIHLEGPGDEARFLFRSGRAGSIIVERTPGNMPNLDMLVGVDERGLRPRGMMHVAAGEKTLVVFRYRGMEPLVLDAGFLFTPDSTLDCGMKVVQISMHAWRARIWLRNEGSEPVMVFRPSAGTVDWYAGNRLVAAARPGRPAQRTLLAPKSSLQYETVLSADTPRGPDSARIMVGGAGDEITCHRSEGGE